MFEVQVRVIEKKDGKNYTVYTQTYNGSNEVLLLRFAKQDITKRIVERV